MNNKIRILIAEDFDILREDIAQTINSQNDMVTVGTAANGQEIRELAFKTDFDIILMDIEMESINAGIIATEHILDEIPEAKVIFLTAHETDNMIITAMGSGAMDYIVKGSSDEDLLMHIRAVWEGNPMLDARIHETIMQEYSRLRRSEQSLLFFINNISQLTLAEREIVKLLLEDKKIREIADERCVEEVTVKTQIKSILRKFGCRRTKEITKMIKDLNIVHLF